jgi:hypothetical protein
MANGRLESLLPPDFSRRAAYTLTNGGGNEGDE